ncbi:hypothetical protein ACQYWQ_07840 [Streptomyces sp. P6-2-1]
MRTGEFASQGPLIHGGPEVPSSTEREGSNTMNFLTDILAGLVHVVGWLV